MNQPDLFAAEGLPAAHDYRPDPDTVRARLERILDEARSADTMPWEPSRAGLYRLVVPQMTNWLPEDEAARWRAEFAAELERLERGEAA